MPHNTTHLKLIECTHSNRGNKVVSNEKALVLEIAKARDKASGTRTYLSKDQIAGFSKNCFLHIFTSFFVVLVTQPNFLNVWGL